MKTTAAAMATSSSTWRLRPITDTKAVTDSLQGYRGTVSRKTGFTVATSHHYHRRRQLPLSGSFCTLLLAPSLSPTPLEITQVNSSLPLHGQRRRHFYTFASQTIMRAKSRCCCHDGSSSIRPLLPTN